MTYYTIKKHIFQNDEPSIHFCKNMTDDKYECNDLVNKRISENSLFGYNF